MAFSSGGAGVTLKKSWDVLAWAERQLLHPGCLDDGIHRTKERRRGRLIGYTGYISS